MVMANHQHIVLVSGGRLGDKNFFSKILAETPNRLLICCDGGADHLAAMSMLPDVLLGDMDSIEPMQLAHCERQGVKIIKYSVDKDFSDTALALDFALSLHPQTIDIWGAQGGRIDHALSNLFLLLKARKEGIKARLMDEYCEAFTAMDDVVFTESKECVVSLLALSPCVSGITLQGFLYPLTDGKLKMSESRGLSNVITADPATVHIRSGHLLVVRYWQKDVFPGVH